MTAQALIVATIGVIACADDLRRRRIANWIPGAACLSGIVLQSVEHGWSGAVSALTGTITGAAVFLMFYLLGGMGGGDVKLMAGFGALLGAKRLLIAALWTAGCGGVLALLVIAAHAICDLLRRKERRVAPTPAPRTIPYAPAIAAGVWLSLLGTT